MKSDICMKRGTVWEELHEDECGPTSSAVENL